MSRILQFIVIISLTTVLSGCGASFDEMRYNIQTRVYANIDECTQGIMDSNVYDEWAAMLFEECHRKYTGDQEAIRYYRELTRQEQASTARLNARISGAIAGASRMIADMQSYNAAPGDARAERLAEAADRTATQMENKAERQAGAVRAAAVQDQFRAALQPSERIFGNDAPNMQRCLVPQNPDPTNERDRDIHVNECDTDVAAIFCTSQKSQCEEWGIGAHDRLSFRHLNNSGKSLWAACPGLSGFSERRGVCIWGFSTNGQVAPSSILTGRVMDGFHAVPKPAANTSAGAMVENVLRYTCKPVICIKGGTCPAEFRITYDIANKVDDNGNEVKFSGNYIESMLVPDSKVPYLTRLMQHRTDGSMREDYRSPSAEATKRLMDRRISFAEFEQAWAAATDAGSSFYQCVIASN